MRATRIVWTAAMMVLGTCLAQAQENTTATLAGIDAQIQKQPDDPMLYYRKAQSLMKLGHRADGYETAQKAMKLFIAAKNDLAWMLLESVDAGPVRVDVNFNMGPQERNPPQDGIVEPLSFRVWASGDEAKLLEIIDFEIAMSDGKPDTAALGAMQPGGVHANFGMLKPDAKYEEIRKKALELIAKRHPQPAASPAPTESLTKN